MIEKSLWFISLLSITFSLFACMSFYHFRKRERMLEKYKTTLIIAKSFAEDAVASEFNECSAQDIVNQIDEVLNAE